MNKRNKFNVDDKVYVSNDMFDNVGTVMGFGYGGECKTVYYHIRFEYDKIILDARNIPEEDLEPIKDNTYINFKNGSYVKVIPGKNEFCCDCCGRGVCEDSDYNEDDGFENKLDDDEIEDYKYNKSCENLDNNKKFNLGDLYVPSSFPQIVDYIYNEEKATTVLKWSDGTITKATVQMGDEPDRLTGFAYAVAKKYYGGNDFFAEADYWLIRKPRREKALIKKLKQDAENERKKEEKRKRNRERRVLRAKALDRKREYETRKLAAEKYGVPVEWNEDNA